MAGAIILLVIAGFAVLGVYIARGQIRVARALPCPNCHVLGRVRPHTQRTLGIIGGATKTMRCGNCGYRW